MLLSSFSPKAGNEYKEEKTCNSQNNKVEEGVVIMRQKRLKLASEECGMEHRLRAEEAEAQTQGWGAGWTGKKEANVLRDPDGLISRCGRWV